MFDWIIDSAFLFCQAMVSLFALTASNLIEFEMASVCNFLLFFYFLIECLNSMILVADDDLVYILFESLDFRSSDIFNIQLRPFDFVWRLMISLTVSILYKLILETHGFDLWLGQFSWPPRFHLVHLEYGQLFTASNWFCLMLCT